MREGGMGKLWRMDVDGVVETGMLVLGSWWARAHTLTAPAAVVKQRNTIDFECPELAPGMFTLEPSHLPWATTLDFAPRGRFLKRVPNAKQH